MNLHSGVGHALCAISFRVLIAVTTVSVHIFCAAHVAFPHIWTHHFIEYDTLTDAILNGPILIRWGSSWIFDHTPMTVMLFLSTRRIYPNRIAMILNAREMLLRDKIDLPNLILSSCHLRAYLSAPWSGVNVPILRSHLYSFSVQSYFRQVSPIHLVHLRSRFWIISGLTLSNAKPPPWTL